MTRILSGLVAAGLLCAATLSAGQTWPAKPVRIVTPYAAGGSNDLAARILAERLTQRLGQQTVVENKPGANNRIGTELVAKSAPDGYTLFFCATPHATNPGLYKLPYDTVNDFAPIVHAVTLPLVILVQATSPAKSVAELMDLARKDAANRNIGSPGNASGPHFVIELLSSVTGVPLQHIPYKGDPPVVQDLLGGRLYASVGSIGPAIPHIKSGKLRALAVTSPQRSSQLPDVPTIAEQGFPNAEAFAWFALLAPAGTPTDVVAKLNSEVNLILKEPDVANRLLGLGMTPVGGSADQLGLFIRTEIDRWTKLSQTRTIKVD